MTILLLPPILVTGVFGMNTKCLPFTDMNTAFLWTAVRMIGSAITVYLMIWCLGIFQF